MHRKYRFFGGSVEKNKDPPIFEINWMVPFDLARLRVKEIIPKLHLPSKINFTKILKHSVIFFEKKMELHEFKKKKLNE